LRRQPLQIGGERAETLGPFLREAEQRGEFAETFKRPSAFVAQVTKSRANVLKRDTVARQGAHADERVAEGIHRETH
jgi:hypothetical protein